MKNIIIDYNMGNLRSVQKAFARIGAEVTISSNPDEVVKADKLILPGVGHFKKGIQHLNESGLADIIKHKAAEKTPILGICLGMQLMTSFSEEGDCEGLNLVQAKTIHFSKKIKTNTFKIPHIGWNTIEIKKENPLLVDGNAQMYFVHSYAVFCENENDILCETEYGTRFHSAFHKGNIFGLQFHPEKSHKPGLEILRSFINLKTL